MPVIDDNLLASGTLSYAKYADEATPLVTTKSSRKSVVKIVENLCFVSSIFYLLLFRLKS